MIFSEDPSNYIEKDPGHNHLRGRKMHNNNICLKPKPTMKRSLHSSTENFILLLYADHSFNPSGQVRVQG